MRKGLNRIEAQFTALRYFTLDGSDYPSHTAQEAAIEGPRVLRTQNPLRFCSDREGVNVEESPIVYS